MVNDTIQQVDNVLWVPVQGLPGIEVSSMGDVRGAKVHASKTGYLMISYKSRPYYVHRLVAQTFLSGSGETVNHKDLNKHNNAVSNLEWATHKENINHARRIYGNYNAVGEQNGKSKLTENDVKEIRKMLSAGIPQRTIAKQFNVSRGPISGIALNILWTHVK